MVGRRVKGDGVSRANPGAHEKDAEDPYRDPTQVPLVEKTQACRFTLAKGIRQISPVTSEEGVPALKRAGRSDEGALTV
jgi:hypothetical protein